MSSDGHLDEKSYEALLNHLREEFDALDGLPVPRLLAAGTALCFRRHMEMAERRYERGDHMSLVPDPNETTMIPVWLLEGLAGYLMNSAGEDGGELPGELRTLQRHFSVHHDRWAAVKRLEADGMKQTPAMMEVAGAHNVEWKTVERSYRLIERLRPSLANPEKD